MTCCSGRLTSFLLLKLDLSHVALFVDGLAIFADLGLFKQNRLATDGALERGIRNWHGGNTWQNRSYAPPRSSTIDALARYCYSLSRRKKSTRAKAVSPKPTTPN